VPLSLVRNCLAKLPVILSNTILRSTELDDVNCLMFKHSAFEGSDLISCNAAILQTDDPLERAGYALSYRQKFDVIVEYFIIHGKYYIFEINEVLFKYGQPLLGE